MRRALLALVLALGPAGWARAEPLPDCRALLPALQQDPTSVQDGEPLLTVDNIVSDRSSGDELRVCTGIARYRSISTHLTYTAKWDPEHAGVGIEAHATTFEEAAARARSLRIKFHPYGDGTYTMRNLVPYCGDADFTRQATKELQFGISIDDGFFREPSYSVFTMRSNGAGTGVMANCVATVGDDQGKGDIFLGSNWVRGQMGRRFEFYVLPGPQGFQLKNRLWDLSAE